MGVDPDEVDAAEERAEQTTTTSKSKKQVVTDAIAEQDAPMRADVRAYAEQFGVDGDNALAMVEKLRKNGEAMGGYEGPFRFV